MSASATTKMSSATPPSGATAAARLGGATRSAADSAALG